MKLECPVIRDLLPLYAENMASEESVGLIREHLEQCDECRDALEQLCRPEVEAVPDGRALTHIQYELRRRRRLNAWTALLLTAAILTGLFAWAITPVAVSLQELEVSAEEFADGIILTFTGDYALISHEQTLDPDTGKQIYTLLAARRRCFHGGRKQSWRIGTDEIGQIWYAAACPGEEDTLLWGNSDGGRISLPRLVLGYYCFIALGLAALCLGGAFLLRKRKGAVYPAAAGGFFALFALTDILVTGGDWRMYYSSDLPVVFGMLTVIAGLATAGSCCAWKLWMLHREEK